MTAATRPPGSNRTDADRGCWQRLSRIPLVRDLQAPSAPPIPRRVFLAALVLALAFAGFNQLAVPLRASHGARVTGDEPFYLLTTVSLMEDGDLDLANDYQLKRYRAYFDHPQDLWHQSVPLADGRLLSPHNVGTSLLILPAYAIGGLDGAKRFLAALGGVTIGFALLLAYRATASLGAALLAATLLGVSAPLFIYSSQIYPEAPAALLVSAIGSLLLGQRGGRGTAILLVAGLNGLVWLGVKYAFVGTALAGLGLVRLRPRGRWFVLALLLASAAGYLWFHWATYGGLTPYHVNRIYAGRTTIELVGLHLEVWNRLYRLVGLWVDREFGLIRWAPGLLLVFPALPVLARRAGPARWVVACVVGAQLLVATFLSITMRGWWFPGRMLIAALPVLVIPLAESIAAIRGRAWLAVPVGLLGIFSLGISLALYEAGAAEVVVLAVDPFALPWPPFQSIAGLFPVYTSYTLGTWLLTGVWLLIAAGLIALGSARLDVGPISVQPADRAPAAAGQVPREF